MFGTVGSASYKFNNNEVKYHEGTAAYPMVDTWTIKDNAEVVGCTNTVAAIVENVKFAPTDAGQIISLLFDDACTDPNYTTLVNTKGYNIGVDVNGKVLSLTPGENRFKNEE